MTSKHRIYTTSFASVYPLYVAKAQRKGRARSEVDSLIRWLTGYSQQDLETQLEKQTDFETFFKEAPAMNPARTLIKGVVCGVRVEDVEEPTMREIRYLDKLVDELAKGKAMEKVLSFNRHSNPMKKTLTSKQRAELLEKLKERFVKNPHRHKTSGWEQVEARLAANPAKLRSLLEMEETGGEPDVIGHDSKSGEIIFCDCSAESPLGRRSLCYDREALDARKLHKPANSSLDLAAAMGVELLDEEQYLELQALQKFDTKTSSWLKTPPEVRKLGGALFGDFRYGRVFFYHNGADSYYGARGFRGILRV